VSKHVSALGEIWRFEIRYQIRQPLFFLSALVLFGIGVGAMSSDVGVGFTEAPAQAVRNSPYVICSLMAALSILGLFVVTAFVAGAALRDFEHDCHMLFFSRPITRSDYLAGRFLGAMTVSALLFVVLTMGFLAGQLAPWQDEDKLGPIQWWPFVYGLLAFALPNLLAMGALFFAVAIWTRRMLWTYLGVILFVTLQDAVEGLANLEGIRWLGGLAEPLGLAALELETRYWTVSQYNGSLPSLLGLLGGNRLLWLALGAGFLVLAWLRFDVARAARATHRSHDESPGSAPTPASVLPVARKETGARAGLRSLLHRCRFEIAWVLRSPFLLVCVLLAMTVVGAVAWFSCHRDGNPVFPHTSIMARLLPRALGSFLSVLVVFYTGELIWRDRSHGMSGLVDATPAGSLGFLVSRLVAIASAVLVVISASILAAMGVQLLRGPVPLEPLLYVKTAAIVAWPALLLAAPCLLVQVLVRGKFLGYLLLVALFTLRFALPLIGLDSHLYLYGEHPPLAYSEMDGYGPTALPFVWFSLYWSGVAALLLLATVRLWPRGEVPALGRRLRTLVSGPFSRAWLAFTIATACVAASLFALVYVNTRILNEGLGPEGHRERRARYEKLYGEYATLPLPRVTAVRSEIDVHPHERRLEIRGKYEVVNTGSVSIRTLPLTVGAQFEEGIFPIDEGIRLLGIDLPDHLVVVDDIELGFHVYELREPLPPGGTMEIGFHVVVENNGFRNHRPNLQVLRNGTFFTDRTVFPFLGYAASQRLLDPRHRRKYGLEEVQRMLTLEDPRGPEKNALEADWVEVETILSTSRDQTALAPGDLVSHRLEGDRQIFHYRTSAPVLQFVTFASARYEVLRDRMDDVEIEIHYHPDHGANVPRMMHVARTCLERFSEWFGPYPHRVLRIAEIPSTNGQIAVSLGSLIGFSESFGFLNEVEEGQLDTVAWVTAHEVAHQWWGNQVAPANCQGSTMIVESLAEFTALLLLEELFDVEEVRRFRRKELDGYLAGRGKESREELPLLRVENQAYIHYNKGALVFSALAHGVGRDPLILALRGFLEEHRFVGPPYPRTTDLLERLRLLVSDEQTGLLVDLFERITVYDLRVADATATVTQEGSYTVQADLRGRRFLADGHGVEVEQATLGTPVDVEIRGEDGVLWRETVVLSDGSRLLRVEVRSRPVEVEVDPDCLLIDRVRDDNKKTVSVGRTEKAPDPQRP